MDRTSENHSISQQLDEIKKYDEAAIAALWDRCYPALAKFAEKRLEAIGIQQRAFNGEDVAASALLSFLRAVQRNRFPMLDSEDGLFRLLRRITIRKVIDRKRKSQTLKAGSGDVRGESAFGSNADSGTALGIDGVQGESPSPEWLAIMEEECQKLFALLQDEELQSIAYYRLEGYSNSEIATKLGCAVATVERRLKEIRARWSIAIQTANQNSPEE